MQVEKTSLPGVLVLTPEVFTDERGFFQELFQVERYRETLGLPTDVHFVQDNFSVSKKGALRGLHYQVPPRAQGKLVTVLRGRVLDVVVDIRTGSPTFGQHVMVELSGENHNQLWIPVGFAHGFVALEDETAFLYKCTDTYSKEHERGILWSDPELGIPWHDVPFVVSEKDQQYPFLKDIAPEFVFKE